jgi:Lon protease-like protein
MAECSSNLDLPPRFTGLVRLFPLPNLVLFPGVVQPLHIFEPRYRQMIEDALAADELVAMALMKPGWEPHYEGRPAIYSTVCIGKIVTHARLDDGRFNLLLQGLQRAAIEREIATDRLYRMAEVTPLATTGNADDSQVLALGANMRRQFLRLCNQDDSMDEDSIQTLLEAEWGLEKLADMIAFALNACPLAKQRVLEAGDLATRLSLICGELKRQLEPAHQDEFAGFPPCFSVN